MSEKKKPKGNYEIGYGRPPKNQWAKGTSGNPRGRPKGVKNRGSILRKILNSPIKLRVNGKLVTVPRIEAVYMRQVEDALRGSIKAAIFLSKEAEALEVSFESPCEVPKDIAKMTTEEKIRDYREQVKVLEAQLQVG